MIPLLKIELNIFSKDYGKVLKKFGTYKCDKGAANPSIVLMISNAPRMTSSGFQTVKIEGDWTTYQIDLSSSRTDNNGRLTLYLGGKMEAGSNLYIDSVSLKQVK